MYQQHCTIPELQRLLKEEGMPDSMMYDHLEECEICKARLKSAVLLNALEEDDTILRGAIHLLEEEDMVHRKKLAAGLVMQLGTSRAGKKVKAVLQGKFTEQVIDREMLSEQEQTVGDYTVKLENGKLLLGIPCEETMAAEIILDYGASDGRLAVKTTEWDASEKAAVAEFEEVPEEEFRIFAAVRPVQEIEADEEEDI
ncbi:MAG: hypothetical protein J6J42_05050 [Lachnospiraceae bacterium]|nr:hypothetical protein [Lachnospiraceae bacterium]